MPVSEKPSKRSLPALNILPGDPENLGPSKVARSVRGEASTASLITPARMPLGKLGLSAGNSKNTPFPAAAGDSGYDSGNYSEQSTFLGSANASHDEFEDACDSGTDLLNTATMEAAEQELLTMEAVQQELEMCLRPVIGDSEFMLQIKLEICNSVSCDFEINCYYIIIIFLLIESK